MTATSVAERARKAGTGASGAARDAIPALEWAAAVFGALLLVAAVAFLVREALRPERPGPVSFRVVEIQPVGAGFLVEFEARNEGGAAYGELEVEAILRGPSGREERAHATLDYLPRGSTRRGGFFFRSDPRGRELDVAAKGFREP